MPSRITDLKPDTHEWRVAVAMYAHQFFGIVHDPAIARVIGKDVPPEISASAEGSPKTLPFDPWCVLDFSRYLDCVGLPNANNAIALTNVLGSLERVGLLWPVGNEPHLPIMGERYVSPGRISKGQRGGNLWLSEVFGAQLIIPSYNAVTVQLAGHDDDGNPVDSWGTGLVVDHHHIITNKHVVAGLASQSSGLSIYPSRSPEGAGSLDCSGRAHAHPSVDVAVIEFNFPEGQYIPRLGGMAFRDPAWSDEVYVFGYPAGDGRVIGLVVEDAPPSTRVGGFDEPPRTSNELLTRLESEVADLKSKAVAPAFYRGIPSSEVIRAVNELGFEGIIEMDNVPV